MARPRPVWWIASLVAPLVLSGLILMHGLDAGATESLTGANSHHMAGAGSLDNDVVSHDVGCDGCHLAGHITVACVAVVASIALRFARHRPRRAAAAPLSPPGPARARAPVVAWPAWRPPWLELCVIQR